MFSYYWNNELERGMDLVKLHDPALYNLITRANQLIDEKGGKHEPRYHVSAAEVWSAKWPWSKPKLERISIELLWGCAEGQVSELQIICVPDRLSTLMGFITGMSVEQKANAEELWTNFIESLEKLDGIDVKNFIGSIEKYKKIFLRANEH